MAIRCVESQSERGSYCLEETPAIECRDSDNDLQISPDEADTLVGQMIVFFGYPTLKDKPILQDKPELLRRPESLLGCYPGRNSRRLIFQGKQAVLEIARWNARVVAHETCHFLELGVRDLRGRPQINQSRRFDLWGKPLEEDRTIDSEQIATWCEAMAMAVFYDHQLRPDEISYHWRPEVRRGYETMLQRCDGVLAGCEWAITAILGGDYDFFNESTLNLGTQ